VTAIALRANYFAATLQGVKGTKALAAAVLNLRGATKALNLSLKVLKGTLTLGVLLVVDELITQFITLRDQGANLGTAFQILGNRIKISVLSVLRSIVKAIRDQIPEAFKKAGLSTEAFDVSIIGLSKSIGNARRENLELLESFAETPKTINKAKDAVKDLGGEVKSQTPIIFDTLSNTFAGFTNLLVEIGTTFGSKLTESFEFTKQEVDQLAQVIGQTIGRSATQTVQTLVTAIAAGENAFEALGKNILGIIGDLAIAIGQFVVATGVAKIALESLPGGATIAAGLGLVALGTLLKAIGGNSFVGGGGAGGVGAGPGGGFAQEPQPVIEPTEELERQTAVTVNVEGTVLDPVGVGQQISEILDEAFNAGASTIQVNSA